MRLLVTGGLGYLGGRLAQYLARDSQWEILLGSRSSGDPPEWCREATIVQTRWDSSSALEEVCAGVEAIVHLAGLSSQDCAADPVGALQVNGLATARLLQAAARQGVRRFVCLSTAHVYRSPLAGVITEETCPAPRHPYATSHRAGEDAVRVAHTRGDIEGVVIRLSNVYGPPAHSAANCWTLVVNDLCRQAVTTGAMMLRSSGVQRRDLVPMDEACRAIAHLLDAPASRLAEDVFNVGGEWSPTIWEVACLVQERCRCALGVEPALTRGARQAGETNAPLDYRIDALRATGFEPGGDRSGEIDRLIAFCQASF